MEESTGLFECKKIIKRVIFVVMTENSKQNKRRVKRHLKGIVAGRYKQLHDRKGYDIKEAKWEGL